MKQLILIIFIALGLESCQWNIATQTVKETYKIVSIEEFIDINVCRYYAETGQDLVYFDNNITFIDSIGKYKIGDAVTAEFIKK